MTPDELNLSAEIYAEKKKQDEQNLIIQAYLISRWVWAKEVPIERILEDMGNKQENKIMTDEAMLKQVMILNNIFGGEVKEK
jgi:hypothetical protein